MDAAARRTATAAGPRLLKEGDWISIDGMAGEVIDGRLPTSPSEVVQVLVERSRPADDAPVYQRFARLLGWADAVRRLGAMATSSSE